MDWSWTWKEGDKHVNWLQDADMLPAKVPASRIMVYSYESRWHQDAPKIRLQTCGEELARSVHMFRQGNSQRPIIFVGHSLGGNVIEYVSAIHLVYWNAQAEEAAYLPFRAQGTS